MRKIFISSVVLLVGFFSGVALLSPIEVAAQAKNAVCEGAGLAGGAKGCPTNASTNVNNLVRNALNLFSAVIGIIAVVMVMVGGVKYMTSQGEPAQVASAKNTVLYAAIGIVIVALAQIIIRFVLRRFTGL